MQQICFFIPNFRRGDMNFGAQQTWWVESPCSDRTTWCNTYMFQVWWRLISALHDTCMKLNILYCTNAQNKANFSSCPVSLFSDTCQGKMLCTSVTSKNPPKLFGVGTMCSIMRGWQHDQEQQITTLHVTIKPLRVSIIFCDPIWSKSHTPNQAAPWHNRWFNQRTPLPHWDITYQHSDMTHV